jgi:hypothetical protein
MSHLDILIPFGLPPKELASDLFRDLNTPALATLTARARRIVERDDASSDDGFARTLPHEHWLARLFGLAPQAGENDSPRMAPALARAFGLATEAGHWFIVNPVHFHIARDHLVLTDPRQLHMSEAEARALFDLAQSAFADDGKTLLYGDAATWFVRADDWAKLQTSTPDAASGRNIDIWMPHGEGERQWRKLQNEVQMHWFTSEVNAEREARGMRPVNSLWLWGGSPASVQANASPYTDAFHLHGWMQALQPSREDNAAAVIAAPRGLLMLDALLEPALNGDWGTWQLQLKEMENAWFTPLLDALKSGELAQLDLIITDQAQRVVFSLDKRALYKFWRKPSLTPLIA